MTVEEMRKVFQRIQSCLDNVAGGSGHLASLSMIPDTFKIEKVEPRTDQTQKYHFSAKAYRESEFTVCEQGQKIEPESISGSIVLDRNCNLVKDENGQVLLEPWKCTAPVDRQPMLSTREKAKKELYDRLKRGNEIIHIMIDEMNFQGNDRINKLVEEIQYRLKGIQTSNQSGRIAYNEMEDMYLNIIIGIMDQDQLAPDDEIKYLLESIRKRLDHFNAYFEQLQKGELTGPFCP